MQPAGRGRLKWPEARGRLNLCAECAGLECWLRAAWSQRALSAASLCQTEVQRCLIWLHWLFVQAVSGILTDLRRGECIFFLPALQSSFSYLFLTFDTKPVLVYYHGTIACPSWSPRSPFHVCCGISAPVQRLLCVSERLPRSREVTDITNITLVAAKCTALRTLS